MSRRPWTRWLGEYVDVPAVVARIAVRRLWRGAFGLAAAAAALLIASRIALGAALGALDGQGPLDRIQRPSDGLDRPHETRPRSEACRAASV